MNEGSGVRGLGYLLYMAGGGNRIWQTAQDRLRHIFAELSAIPKSHKPFAPLPLPAVGGSVCMACAAIMGFGVLAKKPRRYGLSISQVV
ncbi:MAG TPA: hypothetical protein VN911_08755 [Candidatus Acidoferrum sp.]|nr:hypothetical protein [Candidatus Acidoferrum sp.]